MRTGQDTEFIVTEFVTPTTQNAYILVAIQSCKFTIDEEIAGDEEEAKEGLKRSDCFIIIYHRAGGYRSNTEAWLGKRASLSRVTEHALLIVLVWSLATV